MQLTHTANDREGSARTEIVLVATDLSDTERLMPFALGHAERTGARLLLMHVLSAGTALTVDATGTPHYDAAAAVEYATAALEPWCAAARSRQVACEPLVAEGLAAQQIVMAAREYAAGLVVMGTHSRGRLGRLLLGSVAEHVLRSVQVPVMTVGPEARPGSYAEAGEKVVLHASSLQPNSRSSAALAFRIAADAGARLILLHVLPHREEMERAGLATGEDSQAMQQLRALAGETGAACGGPPVEPMVLHGNPAIEILATASERGASMIVLGATRHRALENLTRDRTIYKVLAHARCPVLTLRESQTGMETARAESIAIHQ